MTKRLLTSIKFLTLGLGVVLLGGCASDRCCDVRSAYVPRDMTVPIAEMRGATVSPMASGQEIMPGTPLKLLAVGHGSPGAYTQYTHAQQRLMAMRAAQVDAYRNLAEQVYGFRVWGGTSVSAFATQNDSVRSYVDAFIRGARLVTMTSIADGNFEATVELEVSPQFYHCMTSQGSCGTNAMGKMVNPGAMQPSSY
jgi:outer membrane protein FlgP